MTSLAQYKYMIKRGQTKKEIIFSITLSVSIIFLLEDYIGNICQPGLKLSSTITFWIYFISNHIFIITICFRVIDLATIQWDFDVHFFVLLIWFYTYLIIIVISRKRTYCYHYVWILFIIQSNQHIQLIHICILNLVTYQKS